MFVFLFFFYNNGQSSFYSNVMNKSEYFNLFDFNYNSLSDSKIKQLVDLMKNKCLLLKPHASVLT